MFAKQPSFLLFLATSLWFILCAGAPGNKDVYVYRGDTRSPALIKAAGGFLPTGQSSFRAPSRDVSLYNHALSSSTGSSHGYVATSLLMNVAGSSVRKQPVAYLYKIHVTDNMIDCVGTLGKYNNFRRDWEFAALGGIKWDQIVSWEPYKNGQFGKEELNKDYNSRKYQSAVAGGIKYNLAGFPPNHKAWKEEPWKSAKKCKRAFSGISNPFKSFPKITNPFKKTPATPAPAPIDQAPVQNAPIQHTPALNTTVQDPPVQQLESRACTTQESAYDIAKAYMASIGI